MRRMGRTRNGSYNNRVILKPKGALWFMMQFYFLMMICVLIMLPFIVWGDIGSLEETWTDFSPKVEEVTYIAVEKTIHVTDPNKNAKAKQLKKTIQDDLDKEKYRTYFEDRELVMMVLGGIDWWNTNCGTLSGTGEYFINLAKEKHDITKEEMQGSKLFQTGHFAAALYNNCDVFLEQTESIGLNIMLEKTPQETKLDTVPETNI